ncbi:hypothetical protein PPHE_a1294 [Pseudoalteromonas phenolica O-BC30]|nr:hypothetical protein [Pseudoalteromonas phenolica O-BC30]
MCHNEAFYFVKKVIITRMRKVETLRNHKAMFLACLRNKTAKGYIK